MEDMVQALKKTIHELKSMDISKSEAVEHCTDSENKGSVIYVCHKRYTQMYSLVVYISFFRCLAQSVYY